MNRWLCRICWVLLLCGALPALAVPPAPRCYTGVMGGKYPVQMELTWQGDHSLLGQYRYESTAEPMYLRGNMLPGNKASFAEFHDAQYRQAASGSIAGQFSADLRAFTGIRTAGSGADPCAVTLAAVAEYHTIHMEHPALSGSYPVFYTPSPALAQLSELLHEQIVHAYQHFCTRNAGLGETPNPPALRYTISLVYFRPDLVSLLIEDHDETLDTRNGWLDASATYRLDAGGVHPLAFGDLFDPRKPYLATLTRLATAEVAQAGGHTPARGETARADDSAVDGIHHFRKSHHLRLPAVHRRFPPGGHDLSRHSLCHTRRLPQSERRPL